MGADISRERFDALLDYCAVGMQQGRLLLDSDWNEWVSIVDRRLRAETCDLISHGPDPAIAGVAVVPRLTPSAFKVEAVSGNLMIGRGRMYVDGLLAENHGLGPVELDALLAESRGTEDVPYEKQPFWWYPPTATPSNQPALSGLPPRGPHLVYLDVWQREVTHLEDPNLVESAVGVDTTTRKQTAWQVRVLPDVGGAVTCNTPDASIPGWSEIVAPSAGRLSTGTVAVDDEEDPCILPPTGGYRGVENQLYRVEIHDGGRIGEATFKWSRDNAAVAVAASEVSSSKLRLSSLGRDLVQRLNTGDWVEIVDDYRELSQQPGEIRKITVEESEQSITFAPPLPDDMIPSGDVNTGDTVEARHFRVRRWDQNSEIRDASGNLLQDIGPAGTSGLIEVPPAGTHIVLENGVTVALALDPGDGRFRSGDHWVFAARTNDASVEPLSDAPPHGVQHHYARLAIVTFPDDETDCRTHWPPEVTGEGCACTVCVTPESHANGSLTIQAAIDRVRPSGGTICLGAGVYELGEEGVKIQDTVGVRIRGQGWTTVLVAPGSVLAASETIGVAIEDMTVISSGREEAALSLTNCVGGRIEGVLVGVYDALKSPAPGIALSGFDALTTICDNVIMSPVGIAAAGRKHGKRSSLVSGVLHIEDNTLMCSRQGISLERSCIHVAETRIQGNNIMIVERRTGDDKLRGGARAAITATGAVAPAGSMVISSNTILTAGDGIVGGTSSLRVDTNEVSGPESGRSRDAIVVRAGFDRNQLVGCQIIGNRIADMGGAGIAVRAPLESVMIKQNVIRGTRSGIVLEEQGAAEVASIENNQLLNIAPGEIGADGDAVGIGVVGAKTADISGNTISGVGTQAVQGMMRVGIRLAASTVSVRVTGNRVEDIGPRDSFAYTAAGIEVITPFEHLDISGNTVYRDSSRVSRSGNDHWIALWIHDVEPTLNIAWDPSMAHLVVDEGEELIEHLAFNPYIMRPMVSEDVAPGEYTMTSHHISVVKVKDEGSFIADGHWGTLVLASSENLRVTGNTFAARGGRTALAVLAQAAGESTVSDNRCTLASSGEQPAVLLATPVTIVGTNFVHGGSRRNGSLAILPTAESTRVAVVGNITSHGIKIGGATLAGTPWEPLNV